MLFYQFGIQVQRFLILIASLFHAKATLWIKGRKAWRQRLQAALQALPHSSQPLLWVHCASLGEFEQGRPLIEALKQRYPQHRLLLTFYSPSGYEIRKNYEMADLVFYLPADTRRNARDFMRIVQPSVAIFVKYEFWLNFLKRLGKEKIPTYLVSAVIRPHQSFFKWYGRIFRNILPVYTRIFVQDEQSLRLLEQLNIHTGQISGDTRFDRVVEICRHPKRLEAIAAWKGNAPLIIAGSSWKADEQMLLKAFVALQQKITNLKLIIAPHEVDADNIRRIKDELTASGLAFSAYTSGTVFPAGHPVLLIDTIGILSSAYQYGQVALIGGGFNDGIHNILEAATYGVPVVFGPNYHKFNEAHELLALQGAFLYHDSAELEQCLYQLLENQQGLNKTAAICRDYVSSRAGATVKILEGLKLSAPAVFEN